MDDEVELAMADQSAKSSIDPADGAGLVRLLAGPHARTISGQTLPIKDRFQVSTQ